MNYINILNYIYWDTGYEIILNFQDSTDTSSRQGTSSSTQGETSSGARSGDPVPSSSTHEEQENRETQEMQDQGL